MGHPTNMNPPLSDRFVGRMLLRPTLTAENRASNKHESAPSGRFVGRMQYAPTRDNEKRKMNNEKAGYAQEESSYAPGIFYVPFWGDTLSRYRMLAIEIISANTPAAVTSAPAP